MVNCKTFADGAGNTYKTFGHIAGGDGVNVWKAMKNNDKEEFAVKQMENEDMNLEETWKTEAKIQGSIPPHDCILRLEATFRIEGEGLFIVIPLCRGGTLEDEAFRRPGRVLPDDLLLTLGLDILNGLIHLHGQGIIHNDIKPQNIFMCESGQGALLADFGQSRRHIASKERLKLHRHQKEYAALEQQLKGRGSFPVDVWTLGLTLYEVAIGVRPELDGEFRLISSKKFLDRSKEFQEVIMVMLTRDADAKPSAEALKTYAFFRISDQQMPKDQGQELNVIREAQEGQEGEPKDDDIEYFSESSDDGDKEENSDEHRGTSLDDQPESSANILPEDEPGQEEEHENDEEGVSEDSSDDEVGDGETGSSSKSGTTDLIDYNKRADAQSEEVAVEIVLEQGETKKEADVEEAYDSKSDSSEEDGVEWVEVP
ncbi:MAG: kinase-like domain-containing protein [Linnemannia elongata]|nr:MAG: kinase-like domain-containing protein [Linnemannia elongata]